GARDVEEGVGVSFIKRAQEAAAQAAAAASAAGRGGSDPAATNDMINRGLAGASQGAREAVGMARRGVSTVIEKIDPGTLAELIIKATALQEMTNKSLRKKGSPYRIAEISISASIPPSVSFAISRLDDPDEVGEEIVTSSELVEKAAEGGELVLALVGTTVDHSTAEAIDEAAAAAGAMPPSSMSSEG
ncbi:MAG TPA: hypothetical protein VGO15_03080, partial [Candidatus Limnocylindrales bacterium]|nr:hypothetical protein [Candidatus Limnocylindrales bacterium]